MIQKVKAIAQQILNDKTDSVLYKNAVFLEDFFCSVARAGWLENDESDFSESDEFRFDKNLWRQKIAEFCEETKKNEYTERIAVTKFNELICAEIEEEFYADGQKPSFADVFELMKRHELLPKERPRGRPKEGKTWLREFSCWITTSDGMEDDFSLLIDKLHELYDTSFQTPLALEDAVLKFDAILHAFNFSVDDLKEQGVIPFKHKEGHADTVGQYLDKSLACFVKRSHKRSHEDSQDVPPLSKKARLNMAGWQMKDQFDIMKAFFEEQKNINTIVSTNIQICMEERYSRLYEPSMRQINACIKILSRVASTHVQKITLDAFTSSVELFTICVSTK